MSILVWWMWNICWNCSSAGHSPLKLWLHNMACSLCIQTEPSTALKARVRQMSAKYGICGFTCPPRSLSQPRKTLFWLLAAISHPACYCSQFVLMCCSWLVCRRFFAHIIIRQDLSAVTKGVPPMHHSWLEMALAKCLIRLSLSGFNCQINSSFFSLLFPTCSNSAKSFHSFSF